MGDKGNTRALSDCPFYQHGWKLFQHGDLEGARDTLLRSVDVDFDNAPAWGMLSRVYESMEEPEHAAEAARQAIRSAPEAADWYVLCTAMLVPLKLFDEAQTKVNKAIELAPDNADAYFNRAIVMMHKGESEAAFTDLKRALELDKSLFDIVEHVEEFQEFVDRPDFPKAPGA